jgi:hypothetical protein
MVKRKTPDGGLVRRRRSTMWRRRGEIPPASAVMKLPPYVAVRSIPFLVRFAGSIASGITATITSTELLCALGCVATNTTNLVSFWSAAKVQCLDLRAISFSTTIGQAVGTIAVKFLTSSNISSNSTFTDTVMGTNNLARLCCRPTPNSVASFWTTAGTGALFELTYTSPSGGNCEIIIDVHTLVQNDDNALTSASTTVVGPASAGATYYTALDGVTNHLLGPVALPTIF